MVRRAIDGVRTGFSEMRDALTGRNYVADYVQTFTHEVKSPLSAIRGAAELLQEPSMPHAERERFLKNIERETQRIQEIVDRMMELTALETRRALDRTEPVSLAALIEDIAASAQPAAAKRNIRLLVNIRNEARTEGDPFLLRRAISNLLDNAIDFSPLDSEVLLTLETTSKLARVSVRDHGPGIPDYAQEKVFEVLFARQAAQPEEEHRAGPCLRQGDRGLAPRPHRPGQRIARRGGGYADVAVVVIASLSGFRQARGAAAANPAGADPMPCRSARTT